MRRLRRRCSTSVRSSAPREASTGSSPPSGCSTRPPTVTAFVSSFAKATYDRRRLRRFRSPSKKKYVNST